MILGRFHRVRSKLFCRVQFDHFRCIVAPRNKRKKMQHLNQRGTFDAGNNEIAISLITSRAELILKEGKQRVSESRGLICSGNNIFRTKKKKRIPRHIQIPIDRNNGKLLVRESFSLRSYRLTIFPLDKIYSSA